jgi:aryl-alcohol dehydrogenase-like predicted oxidoreductase
MDVDAAIALVRRAVELGVTFFDTAQVLVQQWRPANALTARTT